VKTYLEELGYKDIGKNAKYFDLRERDKNKVQSSSLKVMHGFKTSTNLYERTPMLLIDFASRVLRNESALQRIEDLQIRRKYTNADIDDEMQETSVMQNYGNQQIYKVHKVDWT
jgi:hypothetical protein